MRTLGNPYASGLRNGKAQRMVQDFESRWRLWHRATRDLLLAEAKGLTTKAEYLRGFAEGLGPEEDW